MNFLLFSDHYVILNPNPDAKGTKKSQLQGQTRSTPQEPASPAPTVNSPIFSGILLPRKRSIPVSGQCPARWKRRPKDRLERSRNSRSSASRRNEFRAGL